MGDSNDRSSGDDGGAGWASFFSAREQAEFLRRIDESLAAQGLLFEVRDGTVHVVLDGKQHQFGLLNLAQQCAQSERGEWRGLIDHHFGCVFGTVRDQGEVDALVRDFARARPLLKSRLHAREYVETAGGHVAARPLADDLVVALCLDLPTSVRTVGWDEARGWGLTDDALFALALENVRAEEPLHQEHLTIPGDADLTALYGESFFAATHLLMLERYLAGSHRDGAVIAVPHRHALLVHPIVDLSVVTAINARNPRARRLYLEGPGSISPHLYWWTPERLVQLPAEMGDDGIEFFPPDEFVQVLDRLPPAGDEQLH